MPSIPSTGPSTLSSVCTISTATRPCPITMIPTIHEKSTLRPGGRQGAAPSALGVAMADEDGVAAVVEPSAELLDQHDRAVSPPRAPERDGEIALSLVLVAGQREVEEVRQPPEELLGLVPGEDVLGDRGVRAGPVAQLLDEERVWQEPAVDGEVGVARQAVLVAEGHERDVHAAARDAIDEVAERGTELLPEPDSPVTTTTRRRALINILRSRSRPSPSRRVAVDAPGELERAVPAAMAEEMVPRRGLDEQRHAAAGTYRDAHHRQRQLEQRVALLDQAEAVD